MLKFFLRAYPWRTSVMIALMVVAGLAESIGVAAMIPVVEIAGSDRTVTSPVGQMVAELFGRLGMEPTLDGLLVGLVVAIAFKSWLLYLALRQIGFTSAQVSRDLRLRLMRAVLYARWSFFGAKQIGRYANAINEEVTRTASAYRESCQILAGLIQIVAYLAVSAAVSWRITITTIGIGVAMTLLLAPFFRSTRSAGAAQTRHYKALTERLIDVLQGIKAVKAMAREALVWPLLTNETDDLNDAQKRLVLAAETRNFLYEPIVTALLAIGLFVALEAIGLPLSEVMVLAFVFYRIMQGLNTLQMRYQIVLGGEHAFFSLMTEVAEAEAMEEARASDAVPMRLGGGIELQGVRFSYGELEVLRGLNLTIPAGSFVALTGESGSGKTTLADLIVGLQSPTSGRIVVDGVPLAEIDPGSWRSSIGYVPQEMLVFNDTVRRNVTLGDDSIPMADVELALRQAGAWDFVVAKPMGIDHLVGERGAALSGGQRQRLAIARALVRRPSLLILDEVTTALDPDTERAICATLRSLAGPITILAISHQPAIRDVADVAYVFRNGAVHHLSPAAGAGVEGAHRSATPVSVS